MMTQTNFSILQLLMIACVCLQANSFLPVTTNQYAGSRHGADNNMISMAVATPKNEESAAQIHSAAAAAAAAADKPLLRVSKRARVLNKLGLRQLSRDQAELREAAKKRKRKTTSDVKYEITNVGALDDYFADKENRFRTEKGEIDYDTLLKSLVVKGDTQMIGSTTDLDYVHPVAKVLYERKNAGSQPSEEPRPDGYKVALCVEGGGMRGCVSAGMVGAVYYLNLTDTFDVFYGSSAGSIIASYLTTRQLPWFGPEVYYDQLTTSGRQFIDTRRLLRSLGFGLLDPRLYRDVLTRPEGGKPVLNLNFLLKRTLQQTKRLDWDAFVRMQKKQPLKVMASALKSEKAIIMDMEKGSFSSLQELCQCMHASCLLPGIAGPVMNMNQTAIALNATGKLTLGNNRNHQDLEPLADSMLFQPLPFRAAIEEGATHIVTIRSRPDGVDVSGKGSIFERLILRRFFLRKNKLPNMFKYMTSYTHKKVYSEDVLTLNEYAKSRRDYKDISEPHILTVALPHGSDEVGKLETERDKIFAGLRRGFARAYDALVEDPKERGRGKEVAKLAFPDKILEYDPLAFGPSDKSAFELYLSEHQKGHS